MNKGIIVRRMGETEALSLWLISSKCNTTSFAAIVKWGHRSFYEIFEDFEASHQWPEAEERVGTYKNLDEAMKKAEEMAVHQRHPIHELEFCMQCIEKAKRDFARQQRSKTTDKRRKI